MEIAQYYNNVAKEYQERFSSGYLERLREKERNVLFDFLEPHPDEYILDAGCGTGFDSIPLMKMGCKVFGIDISEGMVNIAIDRGVDARVANIENFELYRTYDKIASSGVFEFCKNHAAIFKNFNRHLVIGGTAVIHFPYRSFIGFIYQLYHQILHSIKVKLFTYNEMKLLAENSGFRVMSFKKAHSFISVIKLIKVKNIP